MLTGTRDEIQALAVDAMVDARHRGLPSALAEAATGTGKTWIACKYVKRGIEEWDGRFLFLAHQRQLIKQAEARFVENSIPCTVEMADRRAKHSSLFGAVPVVIGSRDTMQDRNGRTRLSSWPPHAFTDIFIDEVHLGTSATYQNILNHFTGRKFLVGLSATPFRSDGKLIVPDLLAERVFRYTLPNAIQNGHLSELREVQCHLNIDLRGLKTKRQADGSRDFMAGELESRIGAHVVDIANVILTEADKVHARKVLSFLPDVSSARAVAHALRELGVKASAVHGNTKQNPMPEAERDAILDQFSAGEIRVLTSCDLLTTGYDEKLIDMLVMARPTKSLSLFYQMIGRGTRIVPGQKDRCWVVGFAWESDDADGIVTTTDLFLEDVDDYTRRLARKLAGMSKGPVNPRKVAEKAKEIREKELERERKEAEKRERRLKIKASRRELTYDRWERNPLQVARSYGVEQIVDASGPGAAPVTPAQAAVLADYGFTDCSGINAATAEALCRQLMEDSFRLKASPAQVEMLAKLGHDRTFARTMSQKEAQAILSRQFGIWHHKRKGA